MDYTIILLTIILLLIVLFTLVWVTKTPASISQLKSGVRYPSPPYQITIKNTSDDIWQGVNMVNTSDSNMLVPVFYNTIDNSTPLSVLPNQSIVVDIKTNTFDIIITAGRVLPYGIQILNTNGEVSFMYWGLASSRTCLINVSSIKLTPTIYIPSIFNKFTIVETPNIPDSTYEIFQDYHFPQNFITIMNHHIDTMEMIIHVTGMAAQTYTVPSNQSTSFNIGIVPVNGYVLIIGIIGDSMCGKGIINKNGNVFHTYSFGFPYNTVHPIQIRAPTSQTSSVNTLTNVPQLFIQNQTDITRQLMSR